MDYSQAIAYIESLAPATLKLIDNALQSPVGASMGGTPSLQRMQLFLAEYGQPQNTFPVIHIAGTNGKGSVTAMVDSVLNAAGLRAGRYTGPHLLRWNERYHAAGAAISDEELARRVTVVAQQSAEFAARHADLGALTWFEFLTAVGFSYFANEGLDCVALEVGLGGRWDATNAIESAVVSSIVTIGLDHMHILGPTVEHIAAEKAGIIKPGVPVVTATSGAALEVIRHRAKEVGSPLIICSFSGENSFSLEILNDSDGALMKLPILCNRFIKYDRLAKLQGSYQLQNAVVASVVLAVCQMRQFPDKDVLSHLEEGISSFFWPGRFQYLAESRVLLDGAHNKPGAEALRTSLDERFPERRFFVLSAYQNKDVQEMLSTLLRPGDRVFTGEAAGGKRAVYSAKEMAAFARRIGCEANSFSTVPEAFHAARSARGADELIVCTCSFVTVKEVLLALGCSTVEESLKLAARQER